MKCTHIYLASGEQMLFRYSVMHAFNKSCITLALARLAETIQCKSDNELKCNESNRIEWMSSMKNDLDNSTQNVNPYDSFNKAM